MHTFLLCLLLKVITIDAAKALESEHMVWVLVPSSNGCVSLGKFLKPSVAGGTDGMVHAITGVL